MAKKSLIAYFSHSGRTEQAAQAIKTAVKGDLFRIVPEKAYPENYSDVLRVAKPEWENKINPPLQSAVNDFAAYDVVFVGSPNWYGTFAPPVFSFLASYDFTGKVVAPFMTHGGGGAQRGFREAAEIVSADEVTEGLALSRLEMGDVQWLVAQWLKRIGIG